MKLKSLYLILLLALGSTLMAQDKYEQAIVSFHNCEVATSIEGKESILKKIKPCGTLLDQTPILKELAEMRETGWEIWNSSNEGYSITYFLRRKLK